MNDDDLEQRVGAYGSRWRDAHAFSHDVDTSRLTGRSRGKTIAAVVAAAVVVTVAVGVAAALRRNGSSTPNPVAPPSTVPTKPTTTTTKKPIKYPPTVAGGGAFQQFTPTSATTWWAVIQGGTISRPKTLIVRTADSGQHWRDVTPSAPQRLSAYFVVNPEVGWVEAGVGNYPNDGPKTEPIYRTLDGGQTWQQMGMAPSDCQLDFVDKSHGWCIEIGGGGGSEGADLSRTTDGGATWTSVSRSDAPGQPAGTPDNLGFGCDKSVTFTSPTVGWAPFFCDDGSPALYKSTDAGSTWHALSRVPLPSGAPTPEGEGFSDPVEQGSDIAVVIDIGGQPGATAISTSADGGTTWHAQLVPDPRQLNVDLLDQTHWRLTDGTTFITTDDAGKHWRTITPPVSMKDPLGQTLNLKFLAPNLGWATPGGNGGPLLWTTNDGVTWKPITITPGT